ncbi:MAG: FAD-binding oxidoreductase, partial [Candidatus Bathyarchaeia archaeon]
FTGSEGSIGLMTQATFAVRPAKTLPSARLFEFENLSAAIGSLSQLSFHQNTPYHVALLDSLALNLFGIEVSGTKHFLLVALDDEDPEKRTNIEKSHDTALTNLSKTLDSAHAEQTWKSMQTGLGLAKSQNLILTEEVRIPMPVLSHALELVTKISQKSSVDLALCAHAMSSQDCLLTALFKLHDKNDLETMKRFEITAAEIRETLVGEQGLPYGMGLVNLGILDWKFPFQASLMRTLKKRLDPLGILNPGKIFGNPPSGG